MLRTDTDVMLMMLGPPRRLHLVTSEIGFECYQACMCVLRGSGLHLVLHITHLAVSTGSVRPLEGRPADDDNRDSMHTVFCVCQGMDAAEAFWSFDGVNHTCCCCCWDWGASGTSLMTVTWCLWGEVGGMTSAWGCWMLPVAPAAERGEMGMTVRASRGPEVGCRHQVKVGDSVCKHVGRTC
jgi:hypothetical protein